MAAPRLIPGFRLTLGLTLAWLGLVVLLPLAALAWQATGLGWSGYWATVADERVTAALRLSFGAATIAALVNLVAGLLVAWVLVRYRFPGKRLVDALVDLPFALPTAVAGISLATLYAPTGWIGQHVAVGGLLGSWFTPDSWLAQSWLGAVITWFAGDVFTTDGLKIAFGRLGILVALVFIGLPFVVRTVQPVLEGLPHEVEEAAASLGASRPQVFRRIILPELWPALLTGFALAFARAVGEFGSVVFIAGNIPGQTEILPQVIIGKLDLFDYQGATAVAVTMLAFSFTMLLVLTILQRWSQRRSQR
jgi:sulfate transport system permease protein